MKKRGFTLIELLAVIVILAIIAFIAVPIVLGIINNAKEESKKRSIDNYAESFKQALTNYNAKTFNAIYGNFKSISNNEIEHIVTKEKININYSGNVTCNTIVVNDKGKLYLSKCTVDGETIDYEYGDIDVFPVLSEGLTPVIYKDNNWIVVSDYDKEWYDYDKQKWANVVVLGKDNNGNNIVKKPGDIVAVDGSEAKMMLVWVPRYEYRYTNLGNQYAGGTKEQPGGIDINFISMKTIKSSDDEYKIHPAFTFGEKEINGFWVGKFEISHISLNNLNCNNEKCKNSNGLRVLPNMQSLRYNNVASLYYSIKSIESEAFFNFHNIDSHMIKNSEWGAVAYLSQSKYGKYGNNAYDGINREIYQNKSSDFITGSSNGTPSQSGYRSEGQCEYNDVTSMGIGKGYCGSGASTTGNIYGIYDMNGGAWDYVMGAYSKQDLPIISYSGFNLNAFKDIMIDKKYYEIYISTNLQNSCNTNICYGHSLSETNNWYNDYNDFITESIPWLVRGGRDSDYNKSGIFGYGRKFGDGPSDTTTHLIITIK